MKMSRFVLCTIAISCFALLFAVTVPAADNPLFKEKCVSCHGADGAGNTPVGKAMKVTDLRSADVQKKPDDQLAEAITKGKGKMPAVGKAFTPDQVKQLVAHIRELAKK